MLGISYNLRFCFCKYINNNIDIFVIEKMGKPAAKKTQKPNNEAIAKVSNSKVEKKTKKTREITKNKSTTDTTEKKHYPKTIDSSTNSESPKNIEFTAKLPTRNSKGELIFEDFTEFHPNLSPKEVLQAGSFGGTYFRPIKSGITGKSYTGVWKELPEDWVEGLNIARQVASSTYLNEVNKYGAKCGGDLNMWETSGWIHKQDPYGWFQWYCRFYQGRRSPDDVRQIGRWLRCTGTKGRWKNNLISKCIKQGCGYDNYSVSPVIRQVLLHWAYTLTKQDFDEYAKQRKNK